MSRSSQMRVRLLAGLGLSSVAGSACNTFDSLDTSSQSGGGPVTSAGAQSATATISVAIASARVPTSNPDQPAPTALLLPPVSPSSGSSVIGQPAAAYVAESSQHDFVEGDGYRYSELSAQEYFELCGDRMASGYLLLFCMDNPVPGAACAQAFANRDIGAAVRSVYSCGLGYLVRGGCGPLAWSSDFPAAAASSSSSNSALDAAVSDDGGLSSEAPPPVDRRDAATDSTHAQSDTEAGPASTSTGADSLPSATGSGLPSSLAPDECCWALRGECPIGRPFRVEGTARLAEPTTRPGGWGTEVQLEQSELDEEERAHLAAAWLAEGFAEHASIASFSRFSLQCLALGAPAELVRGAQQASLDEWQHAMTAFGLAQAYGAKPQQPGIFDLRGAFPDTVDIVEVAKSVVSEGCIAETVAAVLLAEARDAAREPQLEVTLGQMAEEEMQHAELAWRFLAWALGRDARVAPAVAELFEVAETHVGFGRVTQAGDSQRLRAHGCLSAREQSAVARRALHDVVRPVAIALLSRSEFVRGSENPPVARALNV